MGKTEPLKIGKILIAASVPGEIEPLIHDKPLCEKGRAGGKDVFFFDFCGKAVRIIITGPGMVNAAHGVTAALEADMPDILIQTGCAGVFRGKGLGIGDVGVATSERDIHLGIEPFDMLNPVTPVPFSIPGTEEDARIIVPRDMADFFHRMISDSERDFRVGYGPFVTVSTVTATDERADLLERWYSPLMETMEGAASAMVSRIYGIPFVEVRAASNFVGKRDRSSWDLPLAFKNACRAVSVILKKI